VDIEQAQREVRGTFRGGFAGQTVSGLLWLASAGFATWGSARQAIVILVVSGFFIFPLTQLVLRVVGGPGAWVTGTVLLAFAVLGWVAVRNERAST